MGPISDTGALEQLGVCKSAHPPSSSLPRKVKGIRLSVEKLNVEAAPWMVRGEEDFSWLGYSLHGVSVHNRTLLLVGSPTWKNSSR